MLNRMHWANAVVSSDPDPEVLWNFEALLERQAFGVEKYLRSAAALVNWSAIAV